MTHEKQEFLSNLRVVNLNRNYLVTLNWNWVVNITGIYSLYHGPKIERKLEKWLSSLGKMSSNKKKELAKELAFSIAAAYPTVISYKRYENACRNLLVYCIIDDIIDSNELSPDKTVSIKYLKAILKTVGFLDSRLPWYKRWWYSLLKNIPGIYPPVLRQVLNHYSKIFDLLNKNQRERALRGLVSYIEISILRLKDPSEDLLLDEEKYFEYRLEDLALGGFFSLIEYTNDISMTDSEYNTPAIKKLISIVGAHTLYVNDLFSAAKEYNGNMDNFNNIVGVLVRSKKLTVQNAVDEICSRIEQCEVNFIETKDKWLADTIPISDTARNFIDKLELFMAGHIYWSRRSKRYCGSDLKEAFFQGEVKWSPNGFQYIPDLSLST